MRTLVWSVVLIAVPLYVSALLLRETAGRSFHAQEPASDGKRVDDGTESFSNMPLALFTVFRCYIVQDCSSKEGKPVMVLLTQAHGSLFGVLYFFTMMFMIFG